MSAISSLFRPIRSVLPDNQSVECVFCRVGKHKLKLFSIVVSPGLRAVGIDFYNGQPMGSGEAFCFRDLTLDGLLTLSMTGKTGIDNSVQSVPSFTSSKSSAILTIFLDLISAWS